jgi:hypothetical protein
LSGSHWEVFSAPLNQLNQQSRHEIVLSLPPQPLLVGSELRAAYGTWAATRRYLRMRDFPIDPEVRIRARPPIVLHRTTQAVEFIRQLELSSPDRTWKDVLQSFEAAQDEWSAMEAVVCLELVLEAEGLLIEERTPYASCYGHDHSRAA